MDRRPKILLVGSVYPRHAADSEVPWLRETVNRLRAREIEMEVLVPSWKGLKSHVIDGIPVHRFRYAPARWEFLTHDEGAPNKIRKIPWLKLLAIPYVISGTISCLFLTLRGKPDVIHVHWPFPHGLIGMVIGWILRIPLVLTFHGAELAIARHSWFARKVIDWSLSRCALATANSVHTQQMVQMVHPAATVEIVPYGATSAAVSFRDVPLHSRRAEGPFRILFVGRHIERKGVPHLIRATRFFPTSLDWELTITGTGDQTADWRALADEVGGPIRFTGRVDAKELQSLYASADAFVLPAITDRRGDTEGLGVVLLEAIEAGVPIVASAVGGILDVIRDEETGLLVRPEEPESLARAISRIQADPELAEALVTRAREHARTLFDWDSLIDRWDHHYSTLTHCRK